MEVMLTRGEGRKGVFRSHAILEDALDGMEEPDQFCELPTTSAFLVPGQNPFGDRYGKRQDRGEIVVRLLQQR